MRRNAPFYTRQLCFCSLQVWCRPLSLALFLTLDKERRTEGHCVQNRLLGHFYTSARVLVRGRKKKEEERRRLGWRANQSVSKETTRWFSSEHCQCRRVKLSCGTFFSQNRETQFSEYCLTPSLCTKHPMLPKHSYFVSVWTAKEASVREKRTSCRIRLQWTQEDCLNVWRDVFSFPADVNRKHGCV